VAAGWALRQRFGNLRPADTAVLVHVPSRYRIRNSLKAQRLDQLIKQDGSAMIPDGATDAAITQIGAKVVEIRC
jgi:hypothetical protein